MPFVVIRRINGQSEIPYQAAKSKSNEPGRRYSLRKRIAGIGLSKKLEEIVDDASNRRQYRKRHMKHGDLKDSIREDAQLRGYQVCRCQVFGFWAASWSGLAVEFACGDR